MPSITPTVTGVFLSYGGTHNKQVSTVAQPFLNDVTPYCLSLPTANADGERGRTDQTKKKLVRRAKTTSRIRASHPACPPHHQLRVGGDYLGHTSHRDIRTPTVTRPHRKGFISRRCLFIPTCNERSR